MELISKERYTLKGNIVENIIQKYIFENPEVLGLGKLIPIEREVAQNNGGFLDILMRDEDNETRYEIEILLGKTDPSHIIRTIEYWDKEKKRNPKYNHIAVIVAEEITNRYFNVISLFNKCIPIIAIQMVAFKESNDKLNIQFNTILDLANSDDDDDIEKVKTDRKYWERISNKASLELIDRIYNSLFENDDRIKMNYNKFYIGLLVDGVGKASLRFEPRKKWIYLKFSAKEDETIEKYFEENGIEIKYDNMWHQYGIRINKYEDFVKIQDKIVEISKELID